MEVKMNKEIRDYQESMFMGLNLRQCIFSVLAILTAEQFLWAYIKSEFLYPKRLLFQPEDTYYSCMADIIGLGEKNRTDGAAIRKKQEAKAEKKRVRKKKGRGDAFD